MTNRLRTVVGRGVDFVAATDRRRLLVVVGPPLLFAVVFEFAADYGVYPVLLAAGLSAVLYTRPTAQETIAASAYGVGALLIGLFLLELYWNGARGSTEPLVGTATRLLWRAVAGSVLLGLGLWIRRVEL